MAAPPWVEEVNVFPVALRGSNTAAARIAKAPSTLLMACLGNWVRPNHSAPKITHVLAMHDGNTTNEHWVSGPNTVFNSIMDAIYMGDWKGMCDAFVLREMDAVSINHYGLEQFVMEAVEMTPGNMTARSSLYLGDEWGLFKHMMPEYLVEHINGNVQPGA